MAWRVGQRAICVERPEFFEARACLTETVRAIMTGVDGPALHVVYEIAGLCDGCELCGGPRLELAAFPGISFHHLGFRPAVEGQMEKLVEIAANPPIDAPPVAAPALDPMEAA